MYPSYLGKFLIPTTEDWVPGITYQPEPPMAVKGGLNPWADERQRELWMAEEKAWAAIRTLQTQYNSLMKQIQRAMALFNEHLREFEKLTGKKSGISEITNYASMGYALVGGPYAWAAALVSFTVGFIQSKAKARKIKKQVQLLEQAQALLLRLKAEIEAVQEKITVELGKGDAVRSVQQSRMAQDTAQSEVAYAKRESLDRQRAAVLRERNKQAYLLPRLAPGGSNDFI